jgi:hypothetical protein
MASSLKSEQLRTLARLGARARIEQLQQEIAEIQKAFGPIVSGGRASAQPGRPARQRRRLSADARKRISDAQKKRWAKARAGK